MDPNRFARLLLDPTATVRDAIACIDAGAIEIALVVDSERRLLGTITDGDVRRAVLADFEPGSPIRNLVERKREDPIYPRPVTAPMRAATSCIPAMSGSVTSVVHSMP